MCKVFALTNATQLKLNDTLLNVLKDVMCEFDQDAFGYAAHTKAGYFGERTIATDRMFKSRLLTPSPLSNMPFIKQEYNSFGKAGALTGSFIAHSRLSTNDDSIDCAHPYVGDKLALIHNGVVTDQSDSPIETVTPNDTEILFRYMERDGMQGIEANVSGYYAIAALDKEGNLHVVRDDTARLFMAYVPKLDSNIIATTAEIIEEVCRAMKWKFTPVEAVESNIYLIFNKNEVTEFRSIKPLKVGYIDSYAASRALHMPRTYDYDYMSSSDKETLNDEIRRLERDAGNTGNVVDVYDHLMRKMK